MENARNSVDHRKPVAVLDPPKWIYQRNYNGREIKNVVKMAYLMALDEGRSLEWQHVENVIKLYKGHSFEWSKQHSLRYPL